ncbi:hypothetical protein EK21DRAFT_61462 [Setomelanomma holmii]|uniref:RING-type domain-containing protein n=1 Tax=Setomelanomma holmii TaxID=210430 RepID=A0A9P4HDS7_9PLEO|nr:hypothetical protein EK21DRAFT_61462 [Setomelanomma holmii]
MPFPYFEGISTDFTGTWTSSRKRKAPDIAPKPAPCKSNAVPCPHDVTAIRSSRQLKEGKQQCPICLEDYFSTPHGRTTVTPVKAGCSHSFCRECLETYLSSNISCPLPWCKACLPLQPESCELCGAWQRDHSESLLVVTVRAEEMLGSIKDALRRLAHEDHFYKLPASAFKLILAHVRTTLKRYEWQFHAGIDLAELLDPFLLAIDAEAAHEYYGFELSAPTPFSSDFPPREHDADDYTPGEEPWIVAFFRQWALDYAEVNGEVREGWGDWSKNPEQESWDWPYKRIIAHKTGVDGQMEYLVKWVGQRYFPSWIQADQLDVAGRSIYDKAHGRASQKSKGPSRKRKRT